jgi:hypothetical protein
MSDAALNDRVEKVMAAIEEVVPDAPVVPSLTSCPSICP